MSEEKLKPCPFCGSPNVELSNVRALFKVPYCCHCGATIDTCSDTQHAIYRWQSRQTIIIPNPVVPEALDKRTALAIMEYETTRARGRLDGMESENRARERQGHAHAWDEACFNEVTEDMENNTKEARQFLTGKI